MKKYLVVLGLVMAFSLVSVASAATLDELQAQVNALLAQIAAMSGTTTTASGSVPTITMNLTIGSKGDEVTALQMYLEDEGYLVMPVGVDYGYFGALTKAAVVKWQAANGVSPASGYFGPISRAALAAIVPSTTGGSTSAGALCPNGMTLASNCTTAPAVGATVSAGLDQADGSASLSLDSYVSNTTVKKGETKDVYAVEVQATVGKVAINRFDVHMTVKPWLYFSKLVLKDTSGNIIAEKTISSKNDVTEITAGSDYLIRFEDINYVVSPNDDKILVVAATVLSTTDKIVTGTDVSVGIEVGTNGVRTLNGKGYTDSLSETTGRTITLSASGSIGNILARLSSATPAAGIIVTSTSGETSDKTLGKVEFKAENQNATVDTLVFTLKNSDGQAFSTLFKRIWLEEADGTKHYADSVATTSTFSTLDFSLAKDTWTGLTIKADIADADDFTNGVMASTTMAVSASTIVGYDSNDSTLTANGGNTVTTNNVTLLQSGASLSSLVKSVSNNPGANGVKGATSTMSFTFTLNNTGSSDLYVSKTPATLLATSTTAFDTGKSMGLNLITSGSTNSTDSSTYYVIPSNTSRAFTVSGTYGNDGGTSAGIKTFTISKVYFDDDTTGLQEFNIDYGMEDWYVQDYLDN